MESDLGHLVYLSVPSLACAPPSAAAASFVDTDAAARVIASSHLTAESETVEVWRLPTDHYAPRAFPGPDGLLYEAGSSGTIRRVASDGTEAWTKDASSNSLPVTPAIGPRGSLLVSRVVCAEGYDPDGALLWQKPISDSLDLACASGPEGNSYFFDRQKLYALDGATGETRWTKPFERGWADHPPVAGKDGTVYCVNDDGEVLAFRPDGEERWRFEGVRVPKSEDGTFHFCPVYTRLAVGDDGSVYFGVNQRNQPPRFYALDCDGHVKWTRDLSGEAENYGSPSVDGKGNVYAGAGRNSSEVIAWSPDGKELWRKDVGPPLHITGHPAGGVVVGIRGGDLHCWTEDGLEQWTFHTGNILTEPSFGPHGEMYTGSGKTLYAFTSRHASLHERVAEATREIQTEKGKEAGTIHAEDGWIIIGSVRVPVKR